MLPSDLYKNSTRNEANYQKSHFTEVKNQNLDTKSPVQDCKAKKLIHKSCLQSLDHKSHRYLLKPEVPQAIPHQGQPGTEETTVTMT